MSATGIEAAKHSRRPREEVVRLGKEIYKRDILPQVEIFGQHEIAEVTRSPEKRTLLLNRFMEPDKSLVRRKAGVRRSLELTRRLIQEALFELQHVDQQLTTLPVLEEKLAQYQEAGLEDRLQEQSLLVREESVMDSIPERVQPFGEALDLLWQELPINLTFLSEKALAELPGRLILAEAVPVLQELDRNLEQIAIQLAEALGRADKGLAPVRENWEDRKQAVEVEYQRILRDLHTAAVDGADFIRLRGDIERLQPLQQHRTLLEKQLREQEDRRFALLTEWEDIKAAEFRLLDRAASYVSRQLRNRVTIKVTAARERESLCETLKEEIGGRLSETLDRIRQLPYLSLPEFVQCCRDGADKLRQT